MIDKFDKQIPFSRKNAMENLKELYKSFDFVFAESKFIALSFLLITILTTQVDLINEQAKQKV